MKNYNTITVKKHSVLAWLLLLQFLLIGGDLFAEMSSCVDNGDGDNGNPGNYQLPWRSLDTGQHAFRSGDTIILPMGTYGVLGLDNISCENKVTYKAETSHTAIINGIEFPKDFGWDRTTFLRFEDINFKAHSDREICNWARLAHYVTFVNCSFSGASAPAPTNCIVVEPGVTVRTGEEVFFDGCSITIPGARVLSNGMVDGSYRWDFGDDSLVMGKDFNKGGGTIASHYYMRPGTYTVTLNVTDNAGLNMIVTTSVTVVGESPKLPPMSVVRPILELKLENNLIDTSGNGLVSQWKNGSGSFLPGIEGLAANFSSGSYIEVSDPAGRLSGMNKFTISVWAKRKNKSSIGCLIYKNGAYNVSLGLGGGSYREVTGAVFTENGSVGVNSFIAGIFDTMWHHYVIVYNGSNVRLFLDGKEWIESKHAPLALTGTINALEDRLYIGKGSDASVFDGDIDEIKIYDKALTPEELFTGFELLHADFHCRISQYVYAQIPGELTINSTNQIKVTIAGDNGYSGMIYQKSDLQSEEKFVLNNSELPAGTYTLSVQILDVSNRLLDELTERFEKPYDGVPAVGIDENNSIRVNDALFFPVTAWGLNADLMDDWKAGKYINTLLYQGWQPKQAGNAWKNYLDRGLSRGWNSSGPGTWGQSNININDIIDTITQTKDYSNQLLWVLADEPELAGVPSPVLRGQTYKCHRLDPHHPVMVNFAGGFWANAGYEEVHRKKYDYFYNAKYFGGKRTPVTDILSVDFYPVECAAKAEATVEKMAIVLNTLRRENCNLLPYMSFVETTNLKELDVGGNRDLWGDKNGYAVTNAAESIVTKSDAFAGYSYREGHLLYISATGDNNHARAGLYTIAAKLDNSTVRLKANATDGLGDDTNVILTMVGTPPPTPEQVRMLTWLNVVHGVKGISWFHYFMPTPPENYAVMAEFTDHITRLTPIVLASPANISVQDDANESGHRVDTLVRQDKEGNTWIFAVRLTEVNKADSPAIDVTFTVDGLTHEMSIIEPGEFSQSVEESYGHPTERQRFFNFKFKNTPIIPGTVQVAGQYSEGENCGRIYLYDDGQGHLYGIPVSWKYKNMRGTVDYKTGEVYVDFGQICTDTSTSPWTWTDKPVLPGLDATGKKKVRATYRPIKSNRFISHSANTFVDIFAPNDVHIYKISKQ